jgi:hypothetical protein
MSYSWRSADEFLSPTYPGVRYRISKMSMGRRLELTRRVKELMAKLEFSQAGTEAADKVDAALLAGEMDRLYWDFGLETVDGLEINGEAATPSVLFEKGPEGLTREILIRIRANTQLSDDERKN